MKLTKTALYSASFVATGLLAMLLIIYSGQHIRNIYATNVPYSKLPEHIKRATTAAHLWFEELVSGDKSINFQQQVMEPLEASKQLLDATYDGNESHLGKLPEVGNEDTKALLKTASIELDRLMASANALWNKYESQNNLPDSLTNSQSFIAREEEQIFDENFDKFQATMDQLDGHINAQIKKDGQAMNIYIWVVNIGVFAAFSFVCFVAYRVISKNESRLAVQQARLDEEANRVNTLSEFIESVSSGNFNIELQANEHDALTGKLIAMREKLKQNAEDDSKRNWSTTGLAQIGEILRSTGKSSSELYDSIIKFIVKYTKSHQGGLFIVSDEDEGKRCLELVACYAFERKKYLQKKVDIGDGLVGQCFLEGQGTHLTEVPPEYISITSGLGGTKPSSLLIMPMKVNETTFGVIEIASFNKYKDYEIELVEKLAESVAATISNVRVNETTRVLLEKTQQQAEEMKSQEEEIRQNMEELEATQEEMRRKQDILERELLQSQQQSEVLRAQEKKLTESQDTLQAIVDNIPRAIFWKDSELRFMGCNIIFAKVAGVSHPRDMIGKTDFDMAWSAQADAYRKDDLEVMRSRKAKLDIEEVNINSEGEESWVRTSKVPIISEGGNVVAILGMFEDITVWKRKEADVAQKLKERDAALKELNELKKRLELKNA